METSGVVSFVDFRARDLEYADDLLDSLKEFILEGRYIGGPRLESFEASFASFSGTPYCVGVGNGLDALKLIFLALDIGPGDEVIVPAQTFIATWSAVTQVGATPVSVDVEEDTGNINPILVKEAIGPKTRAVVAVHLHGRPAQLASLFDICQEKDIYLVEDAAQAHGARYRGKSVGSWGIAAAFSFYPTKNLGALGDGGAVTTSDAGIARKIKSLRSYGVSPGSKYVHDLPGLNSRLDPLQATILSRFLIDLSEWNARRSAVARYYWRHLSTLESIGLPPLDAPGIESVWHHFVVQCRHRDFVGKTLLQLGIQTDVHYPVLPEDSPIMRNVSSKFTEGSVSKVALRRSLNSLSIPIHPWLTTSDQQRVVDALKTADSLIKDSQWRKNG